MLDKNLIYTGFTVRDGRKNKPSSKFRQVKILFEDDISYYVKSLDGVDSAGHNYRYSAKKHCFTFEEVVSCNNCCYKKEIERQVKFSCPFRFDLD